MRLYCWRLRENKRGPAASASSTAAAVAVMTSAQQTQKAATSDNPVDASLSGGRWAMTVDEHVEQLSATYKTWLSEQNGDIYGRIVTASIGAKQAHGSLVGHSKENALIALDVACLQAE